MARKPLPVQYEVTDDLDKSVLPDNHQPTYFHHPVNGKRYEIDLGPKSLAKLEKAVAAFADFISAGRQVGASSAPAKGKGGRRYDRAELTAWAKSKGYEVAARGRVPRAIEDEYLASK